MVTRLPRMAKWCQVFLRLSKYKTQSISLNMTVLYQPCEDGKDSDSLKERINAMPYLTQ